MPTFNRTPVYNLKAVLIETGLKADILRAWERRYNLPRPERTPGGHRLYSEYDIETIKWLRERQAEGLSISRAVELWKERAEAGSDPLEVPTASRAHPTPEHLGAVDTRIEALRRSWLEAALAYDSLQADEILNQAFAIYPVETVCAEILQRGVSLIGNEWLLDKASVQQEHFTTALATRRLETLITATPLPTRPQTVLLGCPPGEQHTFPVLLLSLLLRRRGLGVVYLGANLPIEHLGETAAAIKPRLIVLAAQHLPSAASLQSAMLSLQGLDISLAYGGLVFNRIPGLRSHIPAIFLGEDLEGSIQLIEWLVSAPVPFTPDVRVENPHRELAHLYREKRFLIETEIEEDLQEMSLAGNIANESNAFFGSSLSAALELGDPAFIEADLEWVKRLLTSRSGSVEQPASTNQPIPYLAAYSRGVGRVLGEAGSPITRWLDAYVSHNRLPTNA
jgi:MerR family transcriptional regulator, light-induced transcriptional regulator